MKQLITIIVIIAALAGAGIFGYMMISGPGVVPVAGVTSDVPSDILPLGSKLNFEPVEKYNKNGQIYQYPKVNAGEIGPVMGTMIKQ